MGLTIHRPSLEPPAGGLMADRRLYLDKSESRLLEETSADAAFLLAGKGQPIPADVVARLELRVADGRVVQGPEPEAQPLEGSAPAAEVQPEPETEPLLPPEPPTAPVTAQAPPSSVTEPKASKPKGARR